MNTIETNKATVVRFNKECIEQGNLNSFQELLAHDVINHATPPGMPNGPESFIHFLNTILRTAFPDVTVEILDQVAEADKVTTRKVLHASHSGSFMGIAATHKKVSIHVIDIIRLHNGKYVEHWGMSNLSDIVKELSASV